MEPQFFMKAVENGDLDSLNNFLENCKDVNKFTFEGMPPLIFAIKFAAICKSAAAINDDKYSVTKEEIILRVITAGADVRPRDVLKMKTPLMLALENNLSYEIVNSLIRAGSDVNAVCADHKTPLVYAIQYTNNDSILYDLIDKCENINHLTSYGWTPLFYAIQYNISINSIAKLIDAGADINVVDPMGKNLLMSICPGYCDDGNCERKQLIQLIIKSGVNIKETDGQGNTVIHWTNCNYLINLAARNGVDVNSINNEGRTPLVVALWDRNPGKVETLLRLGANPNCTDFNLNTPLHFVGLKHVGKIMSLLLYHGANLYAVNDNNHTPLDAIMNCKVPWDCRKTTGLCAILKHFLLFVDENGFSQQKIRNLFVNRECYWLNFLYDFRNLCKCEINLMRDSFIKNGLSFYEFCVLKQIYSHKFIDSSSNDFNYNYKEIKIMFPIYQDLIIMRISLNEDERCKNILLKSVNRIFLASLPTDGTESSVSLHYYCLFEICCKLSRKELYNLFLSSFT